MNMLRSIREKKGLTLGQLAARASISTKILSEYEEGRQPIPLNHAKLIAKALWVPIEDLMPPGAGGPPPPAQSQPSAAPPPAPRPQEPRPAQPAPSVQPATPPQPQPQPRPQYAPAPPPIQAPRPAPGMGAPQHGGVQTVPRQGQPQGMQGPPQRRGADGRPVRPPRPAPPPPKTISEGQIEELQRLGFRLEMDQAQLEERVGKPLAALTRIEAKDWIKRFRDQAEEASPTGKVAFGQWPGTREDQEAIYLTQQRDEQATLHFKLFSGEEFTGQITDFTPYTITIQTNDGDMVLRKLAIVYYRQAPETPATPAPAKAPAKSSARAKKEAPAPSAAPDVAATKGTENADLPRMDAMLAEPPVHEQALDTGVDSDRVGEPQAPERDNMDEDRGL